MKLAKIDIKGFISTHLATCAMLLLAISMACNPAPQLTDEAILIQNVSIIDPVNGLETQKSVVIDNAKIVRIYEHSNVPEFGNITLIDGTNHYLMPGLWDAHVHYSFDQNMRGAMNALFLKYGITSVRDTGGPMDIVLPVKIASTRENEASPSIYIAGPLIDGSPNVYNDSSPYYPLLSIENTDVEAVEENMVALVAQDLDFLKAYEMLSEPQFKALMQVAETSELRVTGHIPLSMNLFSAVENGLMGMEHLRNLEMSVAANSDELQEQRLEWLQNPEGLSGGALRSSIHAAQRMEAIAQIDSAKLQAAASLLAERGVWQTPTLALYNNFATKEYLGDAAMEQLQVLPPEVSSAWSAAMEMSGTEIDPATMAYADWMRETVGYLHQHQVPFMAGTDTPIGFLIPGLSLHRELELLVQSGLSNMEAIQAATVEPAKFLGVEQRTSRILEGYEADLLLLRENPLERISATKEIEVVIKAGKVVFREEF